MGRILDRSAIPFEKLFSEAVNPALMWQMLLRHKIKLPKSESIDVLFDVSADALFITMVRLYIHSGLTQLRPLLQIMDFLNQYPTSLSFNWQERVGFDVGKNRFVLGESMFLSENQGKQYLVHGNRSFLLPHRTQKILNTLLLGLTGTELGLVNQEQIEAVGAASRPSDLQYTRTVVFTHLNLEFEEVIATVRGVGLMMQTEAFNGLKQEVWKDNGHRIVINKSLQRLEVYEGDQLVTHSQITPLAYHFWEMLWAHKGKEVAYMDLEGVGIKKSEERARELRGFFYEINGYFNREILVVENKYDRGYKLVVKEPVIGRPRFG